ncbi:hypothetical protein F5Y05DRAFT_191814 [Hypoxylon sp. FL0543]|nr:hypothetical protein F5Y05DRAFT_191814 [Hypoxylon sp. FL0543]
MHLSWDTIMMTATNAIERLPSMPRTGGPLQQKIIPCSFIGRVCGVPETPNVAFRDIQPLLERGVFIELQFYLRRRDAGNSDLIRKDPHAFYMFLLFDESAKRRFS